MNRIKVILLAAVALTLLALVGVAEAGKGKSDRDRDGLPNRWEQRHDTGVRVKSSRRDPDRDKLANIGEFVSKSDPQDSDSDDDGTEDGEDQVGFVSSYDPATGVLNVTASGGTGITGLVDDETEVECEDEDDEDVEEEEVDNSGPGSFSSGSSDLCPASNLTPGTAVEKADLEIVPEGLRFDEIELLK